MLLAQLGCRGGGAAQQSQLQQFQQQYATQVSELQRRASSLDANNVDLHQQLARSEQHVRVLQQDLDLVRTELAQSSQRLAAVEAEKLAATERIAMLEASTRQRGGAIITANSSMRKELESLNIPGIEVRRENGVVHVEIPAERLFQTNTANLIQPAYKLLDQIAQGMKLHYPNKTISIEGHTDSDPIVGPWGNNDQLSSAQATAVFQILTVRGQLPPNQFQVFGRGAHQPVASNGTPQGKLRNRRVELVITTGE
jgi:chemotaxis protein MotB